MRFRRSRQLADPDALDLAAVPIEALRGELERRGFDLLELAEAAMRGKCAEAALGAALQRLREREEPLERAEGKFREGLEVSRGALDRSWETHRAAARSEHEVSVLAWPIRECP